jgi:glycosyltransferase involved in cell wall biosynthesis
MKILYIVPDITDSGGIARVLSLKSNYLVDHFNYEVAFLSVNESYPNCFYEFHPYIKWTNIRKSKNLFLFIKEYIDAIKTSIEVEKPDIIVICDAVLWFLIPVFVKTEIPIVFETHFPINFKKDASDYSLFRMLRNKFLLFLRRRAIAKFSYTVFLTADANKYWNLKNSGVIANPLSFKSENTASLCSNRATAVCINPYVKGLDRLLLVWSEIIKRHPDWTLDIYGKWTDNCVFLKMVEELKISTSINFLAITKDIQNSYRQSSVFLMTSRTEAFGMVLIEAMASGVPCIAYDCPSGPRAIIQEAENGFLIEDGNTAVFVQKLDLLMQDKKMRIQMGAKAFESSNKYEIDGVMKQWNQVFVNLKK